MGGANDFPASNGPFETWDTLEPTLRPLLTEEVAGLFLPWSEANEAAIARDDETFETSLGGLTWSQAPQKYHARSLAEIRKKYKAASVAPGLRAILEQTGCLTSGTMKDIARDYLFPVRRRFSRS